MQSLNKHITILASATFPETFQEKKVSSPGHKMAQMSTHHILLGRFLHPSQVSVLDS